MILAARLKPTAAERELIREHGVGSVPPQIVAFGVTVKEGRVYMPVLWVGRRSRVKKLSCLLYSNKKDKPRKLAIAWEGDEPGLWKGKMYFDILSGE